MSKIINQKSGKRNSGSYEEKLLLVSEHTSKRKPTATIANIRNQAIGSGTIKCSLNEFIKAIQPD